MDRINNKLDVEIPAEFKQELIQWVEYPSDFFVNEVCAAPGRPAVWGEIRKPVGLGVYFEGLRVREYAAQLPREAKQHFLENRPYKILLHFILNRSRDIPLIRRLVHIYEEEFPEAIRGSKDLGLRPIWSHVIELGYLDVLQEIIGICSIPSVEEMGAAYMETAIDLAPSFEIVKWLHKKGVPVGFSGLATLQSRHMITKGSAEWAFLTHGYSSD
ncbi:hypothetical protein GGS26DRAFT_602458 [Hypomontagnella submonticulosa]|nr:hypothetical protein GGS26DRAFT_602458 [Hypomontagnella submonticulosa]